MIKKALIPAAFALVLLAADTTFMSLVEYLDEYGELDFTHSMFIFGMILGGIYLLLEIAAALCATNLRQIGWRCCLIFSYSTALCGISMCSWAKCCRKAGNTAITSKP